MSRESDPSSIFMFASLREAKITHKVFFDVVSTSRDDASVVMLFISAGLDVCLTINFVWMWGSQEIAGSNDGGRVVLGLFGDVGK